ncbi:Phosphoglycerate kinase [uncultured Desulfobacterium sp.]|uniref:Phosphoglycerate kinase n=1 Tax=uncultured Desulfobacterium sp. TaxID=201089 RepID=A0A445MT27_9BACT|nr:Phosphoglycerate kinase [uncultured Desulfobacterium sp.]
MAKLTVEDLELKGKRVLMRVDFNVPLEGGKVADDKRIRAAVPTIKFIVEKGGRLILMSHLGKPKGEKKPEMSLRLCVPVLSGLIGRNVQFVDDCVGESVEAAIQKLGDGDVLLLENLRYYKEETKNDDVFASRLARLADVYVNDAFGTAHRAHASTEGVTHHIEKCAAGLLMMKEIQYMGNLFESPERPFVAILGGAKISDKIGVIFNLLPKVDRIIIGGGMAFTFFKAKGMEIGDSLLEEDKIDVAKELLTKAGGKIVLPVDFLITDSLDFAGRKVGAVKEADAGAIPKGWLGVDIGSKSVAQFSTILKGAKTVMWNGPMGIFEIEATSKGTYEIAKVLADVTDKGAKTVIGGGDSASAVSKAGVKDRISHVSTGGGASLEFLEGKVLPGVAALTEK